MGRSSRRCSTTIKPDSTKLRTAIHAEAFLAAITGETSLQNGAVREREPASSLILPGLPAPPYRSDDHLSSNSNSI